MSAPALLRRLVPLIAVAAVVAWPPHARAKATKGSRSPARSSKEPKDARGSRSAKGGVKGPQDAKPTGVVSGTVAFTGPGVEAHLPAAIYVTGYREDPPESPARLRQKDLTFLPPVLPVTKGQTVTFTNEDDVKHSVFSVSPANTFDLGLTGSDERPQAHFNNLGRVEVFCNIHPEMVGNILVLPNRAHATTAKNGRYRIKGVKPGRHTISLWHPLGQLQQHTVVVEADKTVTVDWKADLQGTVAPHMNKYGRPYPESRKKY